MLDSDNATFTPARGNQAITFTAYVCVRPTKPHDAVGPNKRRFPLVHKALFLSRDAAAEWTYFENADGAAPDAIKWRVIPVRVPGLMDYIGDIPFIPTEETAEHAGAR